jgi:hypothetical protein
VARGFTQPFGINYNKTFAFVVNFVSIHCILALATIEDMEIHQMDVKTTFFSGDFEEKIYMDNPKDSHKEMNILCVSFTNHYMP